jgi:serine/threonine protein kinase
MTDERNPLDDLMDAISDGRPVDWDSAAARAHPRDRTRIGLLRAVARIAGFSRSLQRGSPGLSPDEKLAREPVPDRWGDALVLERLDATAHVDVYRAWDAALHRDVQLELLRPDAEPGAADDAALFAHVRAAAVVQHPHWIAIHGIDRRDGRIGVWMDLWRGVTLEAQVCDHTPLGPQETARLGVEIGSALASAHGSGVLHRRIEPACVVRNLEDRYGLRWFPSDERWGGRELPSTRAGTPIYAAPEVIAGGAASERSDVYALGLTLWFALAGWHPCASDAESQRPPSPPPSLRVARPDAAETLAAILDRAIAPAAADRFASAAELIDALAEWRATDARGKGKLDSVRRFIGGDRPSRRDSHHGD